MRRIGPILCAALFLHACATPPRPAPPASAPKPAPSPPATPEPSPPPPAKAEPPPARPNAATPADLPGWDQDDHLAAFRAWQAGCSAAKDAASQMVCQRARSMTGVDAIAARRFLETSFRVEPLPGLGLLTAYFAPVYEAREAPDGEFDMPVRPVPADLVPGRDYADRREIERRAPDGALAWMRAEDLFFLQIQGSGTLVYPDGKRRKVLFAAHNNRTFRGVANAMRDRGLLAANNTSGEAIRAWLAENRGPKAREIMNLNPRYAFFSLAADDDKDPAGAAGISLPPGRSGAIDPAYHGYGEFLWIDAAAPLLAGAFPTYRRSVMALDTGGAIKGDIRLDLYIGRGDEAGREAGRVRHDLRLYRLVPLGAP